MTARALCRQPVHDLADQAGLSDTRVADDRHEPSAALRVHLLPRRFESGQFRLATHKRRVVPPHIAVVTVDGDQLVGRDRSDLPFNVNGSTGSA